MANLSSVAIRLISRVREFTCVGVRKVFTTENGMWSGEATVGK